MSKKKTKNEASESHIEFFKINPDGEIAKAFPDNNALHKTSETKATSSEENATEAHRASLSPLGSKSKSLRQALAGDDEIQLEDKSDPSTIVKGAPSSRVAAPPAGERLMDSFKDLLQNDAKPDKTTDKRGEPPSRKPPKPAAAAFQVKKDVPPSNVKAETHTVPPPRTRLNQNVHVPPVIQDESNRKISLLESYISVKEVEVKDLKAQLDQYDSFSKKITAQVETFAERNRELLEQVETQKKKEEVLRRELSDHKERYSNELTRLKNEYEERLKLTGNFEARVAELDEKREEWEKTIKQQLNKIKLKEREQENKHELLKRDTQALLDSKDRHVLELKKKNDALELELENFEEKLRKQNILISDIDKKKLRLIETLKLAMTLLETIDQLSEPGSPGLPELASFPKKPTK